MLPLECGSAAQIWCWLSHLIHVWNHLVFFWIREQACFHHHYHHYHHTTIIIVIFWLSCLTMSPSYYWVFFHFYHSNAKIIIRLICIVSINCLFGIVVIFQFFQLMPRDKLEAVFRWYCNAAVSWRCWICKRPWCCEAWRWGILMKARDTLVSWLVIF